MKNTVPRFLSNPKLWKTQVSAANTDIDGSGTLATLLVAGDEGSRVDLFTFRAAEAAKENTLRLFLFTSGGTGHLLEELTVTATSGSKLGAEVFSAELVPTEPINLPPSWEIRVGIHTANLINVFALGGDY